MEIRQYLLLLKKWAWLLITGTVVGGVIGFVISIFQPVLYQTSTKIMVNSSEQQDIYYYGAYYDIELAKSYSQIIDNDNIRQTLNEQLGFPVISFKVENPTNSNFLILSSTDSDPQHAADIVNTLVDVFIQYIESMQDSRYKATEEVSSETNRRGGAADHRTSKSGIKGQRDHN